MHTIHTDSLTAVQLHALGERTIPLRLPTPSFRVIETV